MVGADRFRGLPQSRKQFFLPSSSAPCRRRSHHQTGLFRRILCTIIAECAPNPFIGEEAMLLIADRAVDNFQRALQRVASNVAATDRVVKDSRKVSSHTTRHRQHRKGATHSCGNLRNFVEYARKPGTPADHRRNLSRKISLHRLCVGYFPTRSMGSVRHGDEGRNMFTASSHGTSTRQRTFLTASPNSPRPLLSPRDTVPPCGTSSGTRL